MLQLFVALILGAGIQWLGQGGDQGAGGFDSVLELDLDLLPQLEAGLLIQIDAAIVPTAVQPLLVGEDLAGRDEGDGTVVQQTDLEATAYHVDDLGVEDLTGADGGLQVTHIEPVADVALGEAVLATGIAQGLGQLGTGFGRASGPAQQCLDDAVVDHIAIFADRRGPGGIGRQAEPEVGAWLRRHHGEGLEAADAAVEEGARQAVHPAAQLAEAFQSIDALIGNRRLMVGQQLHGALQLLGVETRVNVEDAVAWRLSQELAGTDVGGDHRLFHHAVGDAARFDHDGDHFPGLVQLEGVVRLVLEHQGMFAAPGVAGGGDRLQRMDLLEDGGARIEAFGLTVLEQVGDLIVDQTTLGADGGGEEAEVRRYAAVATDQQFAAERVARELTQR